MNIYYRHLLHDLRHLTVQRTQNLQSANLILMPTVMKLWFSNPTKCIGIFKR